LSVSRASLPFSPRKKGGKREEKKRRGGEWWSVARMSLNSLYIREGKRANEGVRAVLSKKGEDGGKEREERGRRTKVTSACNKPIDNLFVFTTD